MFSHYRNCLQDSVNRREKEIRENTQEIEALQKKMEALREKNEALRKITKIYKDTLSKPDEELTYDSTYKQKEKGQINA